MPNRANIAALRSIGVRTVIAFSAVGSLREEIKPRDFVVPDQVIDRTKGEFLLTWEEELLGRVDETEVEADAWSWIRCSAVYVL